MDAVPNARRRRGAELDEALLDAAWDELVLTGYGRMTMATVAARARTSEPVLYRRWANKNELVLAAIAHRRERTPIEDVDTGSLREDLIGELSRSSAARVGLYAITAAAAHAGLAAELGSSPADLRDRLLGERLDAGHRDVYRRAAERGELDLARVPAAVLEMPFDLVRHDMLMNFEPPSAKRVESIVDELFLPLLAAAGTGPRAAGVS